MWITILGFFKSYWLYLAIAAFIVALALSIYNKGGNDVKLEGAKVNAEMSRKALAVEVKNHTLDPATIDNRMRNKHYFRGKE